VQRLQPTLGRRHALVGLTAEVDFCQRPQQAVRVATLSQGKDFQQLANGICEEQIEFWHCIQRRMLAQYPRQHAGTAEGRGQ